MTERNLIRDELGGPALSLPAAPDALPVNILIVDDEPRNLTVLESLLEDPGYRLVRALSPDQALLALVNEEFALLILDVQMPDMNGFELAKTIKNRRKTSQVPIIFLTAHFNENAHVLEGYGAGAVDYLLKPVDALALRSKVAVFTELYRRRQELATANRALQAEIVERKRAEEELRQWNAQLDQRVAERTAAVLERERFLTMVTNAAQVGIAVIDQSYHYRFVNDSFCRILRAPAPITAGQRVGFLNPGRWAKFKPAVDQAFAGERLSIELAVPLKAADDGTGHMTHLCAFVEPHTDADMSRTVAVLLIDITPLKQLEQELREANRHKDEFLATLAHELRNPLAPLRNAVGILQGDNIDSKHAIRATEIVERQVAVMARLIDDLMDVARINQGRLELQMEDVLLGDVINLATESSRPLVEELGHTLEVALPEAPVVVRADLTRLAQVFTNILTNAAKYMERGGRIVLKAQVVDGGVHVVIQDTGIGIAPENIDRVFQMFSQVEVALSRSRGGLGIGLSLARRLVEMHGGSVTARSEGLGRGSEFEVVLPISLSFEPHALTAASSVSSNSERLHILVVDDNFDGAESLGALLEMRGHSVALAFDGETAIERAEACHPQLLLLDIGLPKLNGYEVCKAIKAKPWASNTKAVAITGWGDSYARQAAEEAGFERHFVKPVTQAQLMTTIEELFRPGSR